MHADFKLSDDINIKMAKNLLIVESPAKAKTIEKYLGKDFKVKSSYGHIRDLDKGKNGVSIENDFQPSYVISSEKTKVVKEVLICQRFYGIR